MISVLQSELLRAASSTFEKLGFVFLDTELEDCQAEAPIAFCARVAFEGPVSGTFEIRVSDDVASELTANMLGQAEAEDAGLKRDALGEIANVICGNVVPALGVPEDIFTLEAPVLSDAAEGDMPIEAPSLRVEFGVEDGRATVSLFLDRDIDGAEQS